jgi:hypothetical protein
MEPTFYARRLLYIYRTVITAGKEEIPFNRQSKIMERMVLLCKLNNKHNMNGDIVIEIIEAYKENCFCATP